MLAVTAAKDRVARALTELPLLSEALAKGELGYSKVRALVHCRESVARLPPGTFARGPSRTVRRADALAWMAARMFEPGDTLVLAPDRHEIVIHVEAEVLADGRAGRCGIEHSTAIAAETTRRLCCDAGIVFVVDGANGEPLSVGRRTRSTPPAVRRALLSRDRGCRFPGCRRPRRPRPSSSRTNPSDSPSTARPRPRTGTGSASTATMR